MGRALRDRGAGASGFYVGSTLAASERAWTVDEAERLRHALSPLTNALEAVPTSNIYLPAFSRRYYDLVVSNKEAWLSRLAGVFGTRFFIVRPDQLVSGQEQRVVFTDPGTGAAAYELKQSLPRAYLAWGATVLPEAEIVPYLLGKSFRPGREVVLASDGPFAADATLARTSDAPASPVASLRRDGDGAEITVDLDKPGVLVLNESIFEGVTATDNGTPTRVFAVNHLVRGVALGSGAHRVRFEYRTPGLVAGAGLSALGMVLVVIWEWWRRPRARKGCSPPSTLL